MSNLEQEVQDIKVRLEEAERLHGGTISKELRVLVDDLHFVIRMYEFAVDQNRMLLARVTKLEDILFRNSRGSL